MPTWYGTTAGTDYIWAVWADSTTSVTAGSDLAWQHWVTTSTTNTTNTLTLDTGDARPVSEFQGDPETEQRLQRDAAEVVARRAAERAQAEARAEELLAEVLDESQRAEYAQAQHFHVVSSSGARYRVTRGEVRNVYKLDAEGRAVECLCIHPGARYGVPVGDTLAAQKLLLDTDEAAFRRIANITPLQAA